VVRATVEVTIAAFLWAVLYWAVSLYPTAASTVAYATVIASCVFLGACRMSPSQGLIAGFWRELFAMGLFIAPTAFVQFALFAPSPPEQLRTTYAPFVVLLADAAVFVVGRFLTVGLPWWYRFYQQKLRWQLVHAQLVVVLVVVSIPAAIGTYVIFGYTADWYTDPAGNTVENIVLRVGYRVIPVLALIVVLFGLALIVVVPPSIAISYLVARRLTRRFEQLTAAAAALRDGDHSARVAVRGTDEVAALQATFNAMASELEASIAEADAERDRIASLLDQRRELVASVSHELRTPLSIIRGYLDSTLAQTERLDPSVERDLTVMHGEAVRLQRLIDDLFALSRAEVGSLTLRTRETDVARLLQRCVAATAPGAWRTHRVEVLYESTPDLPPLAIDADRLEQIVFNLIDNAVRHSPPGGLVHVDAARDDDDLWIDVADTGEGIAPAEIDNIWDRFYRGSNAKDARGSGIGLSVVRELTEAMGGEVSVTSTVGEGSRLRVSLPIDYQPPDVPAAAPSLPALPAITY
jgi:signal transduction histidine kinase